jgi:hypothetical protein
MNPDDIITYQINFGTRDGKNGNVRFPGTPADLRKMMKRIEKKGWTVFGHSRYDVLSLEGAIAFVDGLDQQPAPVLQ